MVTLAKFRVGKKTILPDRRQTAESVPEAVRIKIPSLFPAVIALGIVSQVAQILFLRELLMIFHGSELTIGIILASWLAWVGVGSRLGAALSARNYNPAHLLTLDSAVVLLLLPVTLWFIRGLRGFFDLLPGAYLSLSEIVVSSFLILAPVCLLLGIQYVLLSRMWRESERSKGVSGAGKTYLVEAAGNMLGGLIFTFFMVHYLNPFQSAVISGSAMLAASLTLVRTPTVNGPLRLHRRRASLWVLALLILSALAFPSLNQIDQLAHRLQWRNFMPQHLLIETRQSKHGTIAVVQREDQYTFFQSGHLIFSTAGPETAAPGLEKQEAVHLAHLAMVQHSDPRSILLIGGGLRGVLSEIVRHPVERIDYIELDPVLTAMSGPYLSAATTDALADPRVNLIHTDGRLFVKTAQERYDLIIVDLPDPITAVLNRFYTLEFFREAKDMLRPGGVLVTGATSTPELRGTALANRNTTIYHTLAEVFTRVLAAGEQSIFFFATDAPGQISVDVSVLMQRYRNRGIEADGFSAEHFHTLLPETQLRRINWVIRNHGRGMDAHLKGPAMGPLLPDPVAEQQQAENLLPPINRRFFINTDFRPIGYFYTLMFWNELTRTGGGEIFALLLRLQPWWIWPGCGVISLAATSFSLTVGRGKKRGISGWAVLFTALATGFSTMSLQIAALFSFQSIYGFVYETVGLIAAIFMGGLAGGAFLTDRYVSDKSNLGRLACVQLIIAIFSAAVAFVLPWAATLQPLAVVFALFSMLTFAAGLINGISFPLAVACYLTANRDVEKSAGTIYGAELLGACGGAIIAGTVVAPVMGITACFLLAATVNGISFLLLLISRRFYQCTEKSYHPS